MSQANLPEIPSHPPTIVTISSACFTGSQAVLVDSGADANFMDRGLAERLKLFNYSAQAIVGHRIKWT